MFFDPLWLVFAGPALLLALYCSGKGFEYLGQVFQDRQYAWH